MKALFLLALALALGVFLSIIACQPLESAICGPLSDNALLLGTGSIHAMILASSLLILWKGDLKETLASIGIPGDIRKNLLYTAATILAMFFVSLLVGIASYFGGFNDQEKIGEKIAGFPVELIIAAALIAPIGEELLFRASLVPRLGAILSSLVFGAVHFTYGSVVEVIGVVFLGLVLALSFQRSKSVLPCILAHMIYNGVSIAVFLTFYGVG